MNFPINPTNYLCSFINVFPSLNNQQKRNLTITTVAVAIGCFALYYHMHQIHSLGDKTISLKNDSISTSVDETTLPETELRGSNDENGSELAQNCVGEGDGAHPVVASNDLIETCRQIVLENRDEAQAYLNLAALLLEGMSVEIDGTLMDKTALQNEALRLNSQLEEWVQADSGDNSPKSGHSLNDLSKNKSLIKQGFYSAMAACHYLKTKIVG